MYALLVRTVVSVFLNINGAPFIVTVDQDSAELTAKGEVLNLSYFLLHEEKLKKKTHTVIFNHLL